MSNDFHNKLTDPRNNQQSRGMSFVTNSDQRGTTAYVAQQDRERHAHGGAVGGNNVLHPMNPMQYTAKKQGEMLSPSSTPRAEKRDYQAELDKRIAWTKQLANQRKEEKTELAHFTPQEMAFLKANPGLVKDITSRYKPIAQKGQGGDTKLGEISKKTARLLDQLIHHGHKQINPRTGLREYDPCPVCGKDPCNSIHSNEDMQKAIQAKSKIKPFPDALQTPIKSLEQMVIHAKRDNYAAEVRKSQIEALMSQNRLSPDKKIALQKLKEEEAREKQLYKGVKIADFPYPPNLNRLDPSTPGLKFTENGSLLQANKGNNCGPYSLYNVNNYLEKEGKIHNRLINPEIEENNKPQALKGVSNARDSRFKGEEAPIQHDKNLEDFLKNSYHSTRYNNLNTKEHGVRSVKGDDNTVGLAQDLNFLVSKPKKGKDVFDNKFKDVSDIIQNDLTALYSGKVMYPGFTEGRPHSFPITGVKMYNQDDREKKYKDLDESIKRRNEENLVGKQKEELKGDKERLERYKDFKEGAHYKLAHSDQNSFGKQALYVKENGNANLYRPYTGKGKVVKDFTNIKDTDSQFFHIKGYKNQEGKNIYFPGEKYNPNDPK